MDPTGLYSYRFRGTYFIYPCYHDSYPSGLGVTLVQNIPSDPDDFEEWLKSAKDHYACAYNTLQRSNPSNTLGYYRRPSSEPPMKDAFNKWIYTIDLDRMVFSVDNAAHFKLDCIPRGEDDEDWIEFLDIDGLGWRCLKPSTPRCAVADLSPEDGLDTISKEAKGYHVLNAKLLNSEEFGPERHQSGSEERTMGDIASEAMVLALVRALTGQYYSRLWDACQFEPTDWRFQYPASCLLRILAPGFLQVRLAEEVQDTVKDELLHLHSRDAKENYREEKVSKHGVFYRFRNRLIHLSTRLDSEKHFQASIARLVSYVREKGMGNCTAIIWSIRHAVIVRYQSGQVEHSPVLPSLVAYGVDEKEFATSVRVLSNHLQAVHAGYDEDSRTPAIANENSVCDSNAISRPDISERDNTENNSVSLPTDIILEIMKYVDFETYSNVFSRLTRATRVAYTRKPRIGPYAVYSVFPPSISVSQIQEASESSHRQKRYSSEDGCSLLARTYECNSKYVHAEPSKPFRLDLVYHGQTRYPDDDEELSTSMSSFFLFSSGTRELMCSSSSFRSISVVRRVCVQWPADSSSDRDRGDIGGEKPEKKESGELKIGWFDVRRSGLILRISSVSLM